MKRRLIFFALLVPSICLAETYPNTNCVTATPTVDTSAYATGDLIGGKLTFTGALRNSTASGFVVSVAVVDESAQAQDLEVVIFNDNPTGTTFTDQAALDIADADVPKIAAVVTLGSSTRFAWADNGLKYVGSLSLPVVGGYVAGVPTTTLYGALVSRGSPTFAASNDVKVTLCISQD